MNIVCPPLVTPVIASISPMNNNVQQEKVFLTILVYGGLDAITKILVLLILLIVMCANYPPCMALLCATMLPAVVGMIIVLIQSMFVRHF
jgi:hypothetical protein